MNFMKTTVIKPLQSRDRKWYVVDAEGKNLGRLATAIARVLNGKNKPAFNYHVDSGDYVIVLNAGKVAVTGNKEMKKLYYKHTGYLGHLKIETLGEVRERKPLRILEEAVSGMLPKNKLRKEKLARLKLFLGTEHTHAGQNPEALLV